MIFTVSERYENLRRNISRSIFSREYEYEISESDRRFNLK